MFFDYFLFRLFCNSILISSQSHSHTSEKPKKFENSNIEVPKFNIMTCCLALYHEIWFRMRQPKIEKHTWKMDWVIITPIWLSLAAERKNRDQTRGIRVAVCTSSWWCVCVSSCAVYAIPDSTKLWNEGNELLSDNALSNAYEHRHTIHIFMTLSHRIDAMVIAPYYGVLLYHTWRVGVLSSTSSSSSYLLERIVNFIFEWEKEEKKNND